MQSNPKHYLFILQELEIDERLYIPKLTAPYSAQVEINNLMPPT